MRKLLFIIFSFLFIANISFASDPYIAKWYDNHSAAVSITYDSGTVYGVLATQVQQTVLDAGLTLDYELVTGDLWQKKLQYMYNYLLPNEFQFFGHGHYHINHDALSYLDAYNSFKTCYDEIIKLGIKPVAYAYPGGYGFQQETQRACTDAGFLSGRLFQMTLGHNNPYIMPGNILEPDNWYALNTLVMADITAYTTDYERLMTINDTAELTPYLNNTLYQTAWLIMTYHSIGNPNGSLWYQMANFMTDMDAIAERNFWVASMNDVTLYARERKQAWVETQWYWDMLSIKVSDELPNDTYDQPLTILLTISETWVSVPLVLLQDGKEIEIITLTSTDAMLNLLPNELGYILKKK